MKKNPLSKYEWHKPFSAPTLGGQPVQKPSFAQRAADYGWSPLRHKRADPHRPPQPRQTLELLGDTPTPVTVTLVGGNPTVEANPVRETSTALRDQTPGRSQVSLTPSGGQTGSGRLGGAQRPPAVIGPSTPPSVLELLETHRATDAQQFRQDVLPSIEHALAGAASSPLLRAFVNRMKAQGRSLEWIVDPALRQRAMEVHAMYKPLPALPALPAEAAATASSSKGKGKGKATETSVLDDSAPPVPLHPGLALLNSKFFKAEASIDEWTGRLRARSQALAADVHVQTLDDFLDQLELVRGSIAFLNSRDPDLSLAYRTSVAPLIEDIKMMRESDAGSSQQRMHRVLRLATSQDSADSNHVAVCMTRQGDEISMLGSALRRPSKKFKSELRRCSLRSTSAAWDPSGYTSSTRTPNTATRTA